jgi:hypothetical protein
MGLDVSVSTEIRQDSRIVAAYAFEPTNDPTWIGGITQATLLTPRPIGQGTRVRRLARFLGKTIDYILEVREFEPERLMVMESIQSPFPMRVHYQFDRLAPDKTRAQISVQGTASDHYRFSDFLMTPMVRHNLKRDLRHLKKLMEH